MTNRQPAGVPTGGQFAAGTRGRAAVELMDQPVAPVHPDMPGGTPEGRFQYLVAAEPDVDEAVLREVFAPEKVAANAGRIYDHMRENGIAVDSMTREAAFAYAASALDRPYDDFYDAWMEERAVDLADVQADEAHAEQEPERTPDRKVTDLTGREQATLSKLPLSQLIAATQKLVQGPAEGFRPTGPDERATIVSQIGDGPLGNVAAISGHRVVPLPDGVELPVSGGVKVRVRLAADDTYTVQRVRVRGQSEKLLGERDGVYADSLPTVAYRAGMFASYGNSEEW